MFNKRYDRRFDFNRDGELSRRERIAAPYPPDKCKYVLRKLEM